MSRAATRRQVTIGGSRRSALLDDVGDATCRRAARRTAGRRPAGAAAGSGTGTWSPGRRRAGRRARRRPRRGCDRSARRRPPARGRSRRTPAAPRGSARRSSARRRCRSPVDRRPEQFQRRAGELLDHGRRPPAGRSTSRASTSSGRSAARSAYRSTVSPRVQAGAEPRRPARRTTAVSHGRCSATRSGAARRRPSPGSRGGEGRRCWRGWAAAGSRARRGPAGRHRHRGDRVERVVRAERVRIGQHRADQRVPGDHEVPYAEGIGHRRTAGTSAVPPVRNSTPSREMPPHGRPLHRRRSPAPRRRARRTPATIVQRRRGRNARPGSPTSTAAPPRRRPGAGTRSIRSAIALAVEHVAGEHDLGVAVRRRRAGRPRRASTATPLAAALSATAATAQRVDVDRAHRGGAGRRGGDRDQAGAGGQVEHAPAGRPASGWSSTYRASACPPAQANAQNGGGCSLRHSPSVSSHSPIGSSAWCSRISGTNGTGASRPCSLTNAVDNSEVTPTILPVRPTCPASRRAPRPRTGSAA